MAHSVNPTTSSTTETTSSASSKKTSAANDSSNPDRFLKLLVAQLKNQDPLNPLDNAQVTSQMAQISTVSGIEKLNKSLESMSTSFGQMQQMQGAALVGREVVLEGDRLTLDANGKGGGGYVLDGPAVSLTVDILGTDGKLLDTIDLGAQGAGNHGFEWTLKAGISAAAVASFRINALNGSTPVVATPLMRDKVDAVITGGTQLTLELSSSGNVPYSQIKAFH